MAYKVEPGTSQGSLFIINIVSLPVTTICVILRFYATRRGGRRVAWEDWFALLSQICFLAHTIMGTQGKFSRTLYGSEALLYFSYIP